MGLLLLTAVWEARPQRGRPGACLHVTPVAGSAGGGTGSRPAAEVRTGCSGCSEPPLPGRTRAASPGKAKTKRPPHIPRPP